jgi:ATP-dependent RNA helicase RhlE
VDLSKAEGCVTTRRRGSGEPCPRSRPSDRVAARNGLFDSDPRPARALPRESLSIKVNSFRFRRRRRRPQAQPSPSQGATEPRSGSPGAVRQHQPIAVSLDAPEIDASAFFALGLSRPIVRALIDEGYSTPTAIQAEVIPQALAGRDVLGCAPTGTGKTAAFVLPMLEALASSPRNGRVRALVVTPTRELAAQIAERVSVYGRHRDTRHAVVYGGVGQRGQEMALGRSPDVLIATPGRLLDLMQQGLVRLDGVTFLVLDEADRMLDMGFVHDVRRICAAIPSKRQTLLFSATIPNDIQALASGMLVDPVRISVAPDVTTAEKVAQSVVLVSRHEKRAVLERMLRATGVERALVFTRTKHGANRLSEQLERSGIGSAAIHGNKSQSARERALENFRRGITRVLVATDVAARGIDVDGVSHVFNFDLPNVAESYVHRIGRTGRAGAAGSAVSLCDPLEERKLLRDIERLIRQRLPVVGEDGRAVEGAAIAEPAARAPMMPGMGRGPRRSRPGRRR